VALGFRANAESPIVVLRPDEPLKLLSGQGGGVAVQNAVDDLQPLGVECLQL
jgi:hypothetical protein